MARSNNAQREAKTARDRLRRYQAKQDVHEIQVRRRKRDNLVSIAGAAVVLSLAAVTQVVYFTAGPGVPTPAPSSTSTPDATKGTNIGPIPDPATAEAKTWTGTMMLNDVKLEFELDGKAAPQGVASFLNDAKTDYFVGKDCHRLTTGSTHLIQCGSVDGKGGSDPNYRFGPIENAPADNLYPAGTIALARISGAAYTQGHQFFIMLQDGGIPSDAAGGYTIIGKITGGLDQLEAEIGSKGTKNGSSDGLPAVPTTITSVTIN
ncbi:MAG: peptidylprolyl isomerase [Microbacteriaceae bacterium]|nr:peptidylprolyl isomerase [Cryobacterium sp.]MBX3104389.1 peptidylprolyl isomerase [Cryobacterium sp.]MCC6375927.1 peptidylprolyl isomerase [Microbacteriaceae bacterium]